MGLTLPFAFFKGQSGCKISHGTNGIINKAINYNDGVTDWLVCVGNFTTYTFAGTTYPAVNIVKIDTNTWIPDPAFNTGLGFTGGQVNDITVGRTAAANPRNFFLAGDFTAYNGVTRTGLAKLNPATGALDLLFDPVTTINAKCLWVHGPTLVPVLNRGLIVGGTFSSYQGNPAGNLVKVNLDTGAYMPDFDTTIGVGKSVGTPSVNNIIFGSTGGQIFVAGDFDLFNGAALPGGGSGTVKISPSSAGQDLGFIVTNDGPRYAQLSLFTGSGTTPSSNTVWNGGSTLSQLYDLVQGFVDNIYLTGVGVITGDILSIMTSDLSANLILAGNFTAPTQKLLKVDRESGAHVGSFNAGTIVGDVTTILAHPTIGGRFLVFGSMTSIQGSNVGNIATLDTVSGGLICV